MHQMVLAALQADRPSSCPSGDVWPILEDVRHVVFPDHIKVVAVLIPRSNHGVAPTGEAKLFGDRAAWLNRRQAHTIAEKMHCTACRGVVHFAMAVLRNGLWARSFWSLRFGAMASGGGSASAAAPRPRRGAVLGGPPGLICRYGFIKYIDKLHDIGK